MKTGIESLAILGGEPAFEEKLHVGRPNIGDRDRLLERISTILDNRWLTNNGPFVQEFEREIERRLGVAHCIAMCNATVALEIASRALGFEGQVIIPSFTFVATAHALQWQGITPVFCDIDPRTHTIDPGRVEEHITPRTTGILAVHLWGRPCAIEVLEEIARRRNLRLLFDASHAFGCSCHGRMIGGFGDAEVFSFHATKFLNSFEGGCVTTNDGQLASKIRLMKNFGFAGYDRVIYVGTNGKMNEVSAAMGLTSLESMDAFVSVNRAHYAQYARELRGVPGVQLARFDEREHSNYQYIIVEIDERLAGLSRDQVLTLLHAENVLVRRYFFPGCHRMEPYRSYWPHASLLLPQTERLSRRVLSLPTGTAVGEKDIEIICALIRFAVEHGREIANALRTYESRVPVTVEVR
ncbi:MAG TPA: DegT/DnrJ/EryC1/StrS family aminotransferase [Bacteroidota bacterium]|nr:DegT/DnrJ/EryC1/StrS family aminotransferase [Bacteroidota bacterium]